MTPTVPTELQGGRYTVTDKLGVGGMAVVHRTYDHHLGVWRAVKFLLPQFAIRERVRARFNSEAHAMARLDHQNIVRVHDVGVQDDVPFMVMELAHGGSLEQWIELHGPMPPRLAIDAMLQVAAGIAAAHEEGIVHRDMKPDNVLVDRKGVCKLTDFGIAQIEDIKSFTRTGTAMGTIAYMAPEQKKDAKNVSPIADVYGMAATLWAMLTGDIPMDLFMAEHQPILMVDVPEALHPAMLRALSFDPERRTPDAGAFAADLRAAYDALPETPSDTPSLVTQLHPGGHPTPPSAQPRAKNRSVPSGAGQVPAASAERAFKPLPYYPRARGTTPTATPSNTQLDALYADDRREQARKRIEQLAKSATPAPSRPTNPMVATPVTGPEPLRTIEPVKPRLDTSTDGTVPRLRSPKTVAASTSLPQAEARRLPPLWAVVPPLLVVLIVTVALSAGARMVGTSAQQAEDANRALYLAIESEKDLPGALPPNQREVALDRLVRLRGMEDGPERVLIARGYVDALNAADDPLVVARVKPLVAALEATERTRAAWKQKSSTLLGRIACGIGLSKCP